MKSRSSSFLIHLRSFVMAVMAHALVTRGLKQVYSSNLLVTYDTEGDKRFPLGASQLNRTDSRAASTRNPELLQKVGGVAEQHEGFHIASTHCELCGGPVLTLVSYRWDK